MPMTKLTLTAEPDLVRDLKRIAHRQGTSLSAMFARYGKALVAVNKQRKRRVSADIGPITRACIGVAKLPKGMTADQVREEAMFEKYGIKR